MNNYLILDAASAGQSIATARERDPGHISLFREKGEAFLKDVAPFLFKIDIPGGFWAWYGQTGWGNSHGVALSAEVSRENLYKHLRRLLTVRTGDKREFYFRFYDPRVLRIFLPTCDKDQILEFFGPVDYFLVEDEDKEYAIQFSHQNGILQQKKIKASDIFGEPAAVKVTLPAPTATLTYDVKWEKLIGTIGDEHFDERAVSGGSRGHKKIDDKRADLFLHDEAYDFKSRSPLTKEKQAGPKGGEHYVQRGGTIPPGHYDCVFVASYPKLGGEVIKLVQHDDAKVYQAPFTDQPIEHHRGGFYIHGPGPKGSDGCIIFDNNSRRKDLNKAIKYFTQDLHGKVLLNVINDGSFILPPLLTDGRFANMA